MKLNRKEYDLIYDAFQYMYFKLDKDQSILAEQILDLAFYPDLAQHDDTDKASHELKKDHAYLLSFTSKWFTKKS